MQDLVALFAHVALEQSECQLGDNSPGLFFRNVRAHIISALLAKLLLSRSDHGCQVAA